MLNKNIVLVFKLKHLKLRLVGRLLIQYLLKYIKEETAEGVAHCLTTFTTSHTLYIINVLLFDCAIPALCGAVWMACGLSTFGRAGELDILQYVF